jgi:hypothetical protein
MNKTIKFNSADSLVTYCLENNLRVGQVWVDSNPYGEGEKTLLFFIITDNVFGTNICSQHDVKDIDYAFDAYAYWHSKYKGTLELLINNCDCQNMKPEVYEVGDWVEVLPNIKEIGDYDKFNSIKKEMEGKQFEITRVRDTYEGLCYTTNDSYIFPNYCLKKVDRPFKNMTLEEIEKQLGYKIALIN